MRIEFSNISVSLDAMLPQNSDLFARGVSEACGLRKNGVGDIRLLRKSVDARKKSNVHFVVSVSLEAPGIKSRDDLAKLEKRLRRGARAKPYEPRPVLEVPDCSRTAEREGYKRPIIVGAGPAGLFAALYLARAGLRPVVVERGQAVEERERTVGAFASGSPLDPNSNVQFGEGGAGTFSDGKLNTGIKSPHIRHVLEEFVSAGAPAEILVDAKPHIGTDLLPGIVRNIRKAIESSGGEFMFDTKLKDIRIRSDAVDSVVLENVRSGVEQIVPTDTLVLAIGHSARDTYEMLVDLGLEMERKPFAVGVRVEHLQSDIDRAQYGEAFKHPALGAADYKLAVHNDDGRGVYTFCMCPGGTVVAASSEPGALCVNGMSENARDGRNSNSALLAEVRPEDLPGNDALAGIRIQREMERAAFELGRREGAAPYTAPVQTIGNFLSGESGNPSKKVSPTYPRGVEWTNLRECLPPFVSEALAEAIPKLGNRLRGFDDPEAVMTGVEPRSSSPVRILRDTETLQSTKVKGIYPAGEGAGYAGGIMSAATDGIRVAQAIALAQS